MIFKNWNIVPDKIALNQNEIHIWLCNLIVDKKLIHALSKNLSSEELKKANNFHFEKDKNSYIASHYFLRTILSKYYKIKPGQIIFECNKYGKPFVVNKIATPLQFNLSHSGDFCLIGITLNDRIGVDIEKNKEDFSSMEIAEKYFSKNEYEQLLSLRKNDRNKAFYYCWTRKEAYIKAEGKGLSIPLDSFDVTISETKPKLTRIENKNDLSNWHLYNIPINEKYFAAVALFGKEKEIKRYYLNI